MISNSKKDVQTVTAEGRSIQRLIEGVVIQSATTQSTSAEHCARF